MAELLLTRLFYALVKALDDPSITDEMLNDKRVFIRELQATVKSWMQENNLGS